MYVPAHFDASDLGFCHELIRAFPFAPMITGTTASHVPFMLDADRGRLGTLIAHVSRANTQHEELARGAEALVVFVGPHGYISPTWYAEAPAVPTWNYCAVHAVGTARMLDVAATRDYLARLAVAFDRTWRFDALAEDYQAKMARGIVAFELEIAQLQGKAKLSQNRSPADIAGVLAALEASPAPDDVALARWMRRSSG